MSREHSGSWHTDLICTEPLDSMPISSPLLPTTPSHIHAFYESLGDGRGSHPSFDPYCAYLEDIPGKIMWSTFFDHTFNFFMAFDEFKRPLTLLAPSLLVFSYSHHSKMHAMTCEKLLRALIASKWSDLLLDVRSGRRSLSLMHIIMVRHSLGATRTAAPNLV